MLSIINNKLYQKPDDAAYNLIVSESKLEVKEGNSFFNFDLATSYIVSKIDNKEFTLDLFVADDTKLTISYTNKMFSIDRSKTIETDFMKQYKSIRELQLVSLDKMELFIDNSIIECFLNDGEFTFTLRFFIENKSSNLALQGDTCRTLSVVSSIIVVYMCYIKPYLCSSVFICLRSAVKGHF